MVEGLANQMGSRRVLRDVHYQKTDEGDSTMWNSVSMLAMLAHEGEIQAEIGVVMPHAQHGSVCDWL